MATQVYFQGGAETVAQVGSFQITAVSGTPSDTTYTITIGGQTISVVGDTDVNTTATNLRAALVAATHPYFHSDNITWTGATDTIIGTATVLGVPFIAASSVVGGTGTIGAYSATTASAGPNDLSTVTNYSTGSLPLADEVLHFKDLAVNVCWGLDAFDEVALDGLIIWDTFTGKIGNNWAVFATSADGATVDSTVTEYRDTRLQVDVTQADGAIEIGKIVGPGLGSGSSRIMLDSTATQSDIVVYSTASTSAEAGRPVVRITCDHASTDIFIKASPGGVGLGLEPPGSGATVGLLSLSGASSRLVVGPNCGVTTYEQFDGSGRFGGLGGGAEALTTATIAGGTFFTEGLMKITTFNNNGGTATLDHSPRTGVAITTANLNHGTTIATATNQARTWTTTNLDPDNATLEYDPSKLTLTNTNFAKSSIILKSL